MGSGLADTLMTCGWNLVFCAMRIDYVSVIPWLFMCKTNINCHDVIGSASIEPALFYPLTPNSTQKLLVLNIIKQCKSKCLHGAVACVPGYKSTGSG